MLIPLTYKFQKLADVWVAHSIDYRKITLSEQPLSAGNFGEVFKGKDVYHTYILDALWGQLIKLAQVASTSELLENQ